MQPISFLVDRQKLHGSLFFPQKPKGKNPAILFIHGWRSHKERGTQFAEALSNMGFICLLFDMRGHGESEGDINTLTVANFLTDVIAAYDFLLSVHGVDKEKITVFGTSFGGYLGPLLTSKRKVKNLALRVPADYANQEFDKYKILTSGDSQDTVDWRKQKRHASETYALNALSKFNGEVLIIEAEKDDRVPHQTVQNYADAVQDKEKLQYIIMKDAPHRLEAGKFRDEVEQILTNWFKNKI